MTSHKKQRQRGRDAVNGQFISVREAKKRSNEAVVETYKTGKKGPKN
jgi:hypothetical protein